MPAQAKEPYSGPRHTNALTGELISPAFAEQLEAYYKKCKHLGWTSRQWVTAGQASRLAHTDSVFRRDRHRSRSVKLYLSPTPDHYSGVKHTERRRGCTVTCRVLIEDKKTGETRRVRVSHTYYNIAQCWK